MDGFVRALNLRRQDGTVAMGYYDRDDLPFHWAVADQYVLFDRFFSSSLRGGDANHTFWVAGRPELGNGPTIFDRLQQRGISWKFYIAGHDPKLNIRTPPGKRDAHWGRVLDDVPILKLPRFADDRHLASHIVDLGEYYKDLQEGTLPAVSFMVDYGASEHPPGDLVLGQRLVRSLVNGLMASSAWKDSAFLYSYDDWGGWYDHVRPPKVDAAGYGFRVPALLVSPYARRGHVDHTQLDQTAGIRFVEENWGLAPVGGRDAAARTFTAAFDFSSPPRAPSLLFENLGGVGGSVARRPASRLLYGFYGPPSWSPRWCWQGRSRPPAAMPTWASGPTARVPGDQDGGASWRCRWPPPWRPPWPRRPRPRRPAGCSRTPSSCRSSRPWPGSRSPWTGGASAPAPTG